MSNILIIYGTSEGQTARISEHISQVLKEEGHAVELANAHKLPKDFDLQNFDGVMVGASVHLGKHDRRIVDFVKANLAVLQEKPSAFFSVSLSAAGDDDRHEADIERLLTEFSEQTGWHPDRMEAIAGALMYTQYNLIVRFLMKRISKKEGGDTNTSRDYEYTDWDGVTEFARAFAGMVPVRK
jgi:menaquinone-dependent protoporphyrinogen oxidase